MDEKVEGLKMYKLSVRKMVRVYKVQHRNIVNNSASTMYGTKFIGVITL